MCLEVKSVNPNWRGSFSFQQLPRQGPLEGAVSALTSLRTLLPELQRYKDTVRCTALGTEVQGHHRLTQTLNVCS